ncbi:MAG TPA: murein L,D-transpeptidase family protein [Microvirga sp.]|jgi:murein L,D-transpeptidase YafK|nr:murein L,D-transpeptidase family protein [Microvirga sp.]
MRRFIVIVLGILVLTGIGLAVLQPSLLKSAGDRVIRLVGRFDPDLSTRIRDRTAKPLPERLAEKGLSLGSPAFIRVFKQESELEVWLLRDGAFAPFETYPICAWSGELGPKLAEGDRQAPEGFYAVGLKQLNPNSNYHRAFNLGFPNAYDRALGRTGSFLMVHGDCVSIGCYAMTDQGIDEIYRIVEAALHGGQREVPVHAFPFRMTEKAMAEKAGHRWAAYWANLKQGYDLFEQTGKPPPALACGGRYGFASPAAAGCESVRAW